jgi:hypothetical protein
MGPGMRAGPAYLEPSAATDQVEDQHNHRDYDKNVDESSADMQGEAKKP